MSTVLVTGGSGFIGSQAILQLLAAGHLVRTRWCCIRRSMTADRAMRYIR